MIVKRRPLNRPAFFLTMDGDSVIINVIGSHNIN